MKSRVASICSAHLGGNPRQLPNRHVARLDRQTTPTCASNSAVSAAARCTPATGPCLFATTAKCVHDSADAAACCCVRNRQLVVWLSSPVLHVCSDVANTRVIATDISILPFKVPQIVPSQVSFRSFFRDFGRPLARNCVTSFRYNPRKTRWTKAFRKAAGKVSRLHRNCLLHSIIAVLIP